MVMLLLLLLSNPTVKLEKSFPVPKDIYIAESMVCEKSNFYILDSKSFVFVKVAPDGTVKKGGGRGQGPGELSDPLAIGAGNDYVLVADFKKVLFYNAKDLSFVREVKTINHSLTLCYDSEEIILSLTKYPDDENGLYVLNKDGAVLRSFYKHHNDASLVEFGTLKMPYFDRDSKGTLYCLHGKDYRIDVLDKFGKKAGQVPVQISPAFIPIASPETAGNTMASYYKWLSLWTPPSRIAIVKDRFLWVCFEERQKNLRDVHYYVEIYDLLENKKIIPWKKMPGRLYDGGDYAYFIQDTNSTSDYDLKIAAYSVIP